MGHVGIAVVCGERLEEIEVFVSVGVGGSTGYEDRLLGYFGSLSSSVCGMPWFFDFCCHGNHLGVLCGRNVFHELHGLGEYL
jgi:hypothetical protein